MKILKYSGQSHMLKRKDGSDDSFHLIKKPTLSYSLPHEEWVKVFEFLDEESMLKFFSTCKDFYALTRNDVLMTGRLSELGYSVESTKFLPEFEKITSLNYYYFLNLVKRKIRISRVVQSIQKHFKQIDAPLSRNLIIKNIEEKKKLGIVFPLDLILFLFTTGGFAEDIYGHNNLHVFFNAKEIEQVQDNMTVYRMEYEEMVEAFEKIAEWHIPYIEAKSNRFVSIGRQYENVESDDQFFVISDPESKHYGMVAMFIYTYLGTIIKTKNLLELLEKLEYFLRMKPDRELFEFIETLPFIYSTTALVSSEF